MGTATATGIIFTGAVYAIARMEIIDLTCYFNLLV